MGGEQVISNKIFILGSERDEAGPIKELLRKHGYEVTSKAMSSNIVKCVSEVMPDLILLIDVEDGNAGLKACKALKSARETRHIPIIVQLLRNKEEVKLNYISCGVNDYIEAPFHELELVLRIKNQLKLVELQNSYKLSHRALEESLITIKNQRDELENNLYLASKIQEALIPKSLGSIPNCSFLWHFQPSGKVGGDIFDAFMLDDEHMGLYMIDVMGHGIASSMLAVALSEFLILDVDRGSPLKRKINKPPYYEILSPLEVVNYLNKRFPFTKYQHYFTIFYMVLNVKTGVLKYIRAAHPAPILVKENGELIELDGYGTPIGFEFNEEYEERTVYLDSGDTLIVYTDGLVELMDDKGKTLEYEGLISYIKKQINYENHHLTMNLKKMARNQQKLKDDLSILEMRWIKFV